MTAKEFLKLDLNSLYQYTKEIDYGWVDTKGEKHFGTNSDDLEYHLQTPEETLERNIAICWDIAELLRYYFVSHNYKEVKTYLIYLYITDDYCPSHAIVTYKKDNEYIWFSPAISKEISGIFEYNTESKLITDFKKRFIKYGINKCFFNKEDNLKNMVCYEYRKPSFHIRGSEFYTHCRTGKKVI